MKSLGRLCLGRYSMPEKAACALRSRGLKQIGLMEIQRLPLSSFHLESVLGEIAGKIGLIVTGCLWLVENNLHERSLLSRIRFLLFTLHQPFSEKSFKTFNAKLMHSLQPHSLFSPTSFIYWMFFFSELPFRCKWKQDVLVLQ